MFWQNRHKHRRCFAACCALLCCAGAGAENLLVNPGFSAQTSGQPSGWHLFVMPQPGAVGRIDGDAREGGPAAMLHTPLPYEKDPVNNWSQNIFAELAGKRLRVSGQVQTQDAGEAALWVQCWQRGKRLPTAIFTTKEKDPVHGTQAWGEVATEFTVPAGTDFLTLRCVLLGTGTAWFDELSLEEVQEGAPSAGPKTAGPDSNSAAAPSPVQGDDIESLREELAELREANYVLADALDELRRAHDLLLDDVRQGKTAALPVPAPASPAPAASRLPAAEPPAPPPYGPYGVPWKDSFVCN